MSTPRTIQVKVLVPFTDHSGAHKPDEVIDLPYETDVQQADVRSMLSYGVVAAEKSSA